MPRKSRAAGRASHRGRGGSTASVRSDIDLPHNESHFRLVLGDDFGKSVEARKFKKGQSVRLYIATKATANEVIEVGSARLSSAGAEGGTVQRTLHLHRLPHTGKEDLVVITGASFKSDSTNHKYPYTFRVGEGPPAKLGDMFSGGMYAWDSRMMVLLKPQIEESSGNQMQNCAIPGSSDDNDTVPSPPLKRHKGEVNAPVPHSKGP